MNYQIFISYRREGGAALAYLLSKGLSSLGYNVFFDIESLAGGKFDEKLLTVIEHSPNFVVLLTPHIFDRCVDENDWIFRECMQAIKCGKNIIPILDPYFEWPTTMPKGLEQLKSFNGVVVNYMFFEGVLDKIGEMLNTPLRLPFTNGNNNDLKHILVWSDFESRVLEKIINKLNLDSTYYVEILTEPVEILTKDLSRISVIVLIDTDVTKLASTEKAGIRINETLVNYVGEGGKLIATHDIIYRRVRNLKLQEMYGYKISHFAKRSCVHYLKTPLCDELGIFQNIKKDIVLHDDEICWGNELAPDANVYFSDENGVPLVYSREYGRGMCIWLNSGDFKDYPPASILKPEEGFIAILRELIIF